MHFGEQDDINLFWRIVRGVFATGTMLISIL